MRQALVRTVAKSECLLFTSIIPVHVMVIILSLLVMLTKQECCHKLLLILLKSARGLKQSQK